MYARLARLAAAVVPELVGVAYFAAAFLSLALAQGADGVATIWPASGVLLAAFLKVPHDRRRRYVAAGAIASLAANLAAGNPLALSLGYTLANIVESLLVLMMMRRSGSGIPSFIELVDVGRFFAACTIAAAVSAAIAQAASGGSAGFFLSWFSTDVMGMLIVTPLALTLVARFEQRGEAPIRPRAIVKALALLGLVAGVATAVFAQSSYPLLFLPFAALLAATYWLGPLGATGGILIIAAISSVLTGADHGPLVLIRNAGPPNAALFLQFYFLTLLGTALPLAALLAARARLLRQCATSEQMYRLLADNSHDMIVRFGVDGVRRYVSPACRVILGFEPEELVGVTPAGAIHPDDRVRVMDVCRSLLMGIDSPLCSYRQARADGSYVWLEAIYTLVRDDVTGEPSGFVASVRDVSRRKAAELAVAQTSARLVEGNRLLSMAEQMANVGHWRLDVVGGSIMWSDEVFRIHGVEGPDTPALAAAIDTYHPEDRAMVAAAVQTAIDRAAGFDFAGRIVRPGGEIRHVVSRGQVEQAPDGTVLALFGVMQDVTRYREIEHQLETARALAEDATRQAITMAETDELTGLANRRRSLRALDEAIGQAKVTGKPLSLAIFDIDHFKQVNDRFGHGVGDRVIRLVAAAANTAVRPSDLVGRIGGEEFMVLLPGTDPSLAAMVAERLRCRIETACDHDPAAPAVTASVGIACLAGDMTGAMLLQQADGALYAAKAAGRNTSRLAA